MNVADCLAIHAARRKSAALRQWREGLHNTCLSLCNGAKNRSNWGLNTNKIIDITFFVLAIPVAIFARISKGGFGSGFVAATPVLSLTQSLVQTLWSLRPCWKPWDFRDAMILISGVGAGGFAGHGMAGPGQPGCNKAYFGATAISLVVYRTPSDGELMPRRGANRRAGRVDRDNGRIRRRCPRGQVLRRGFQKIAQPQQCMWCPLAKSR